MRVLDACRWMLIAFFVAAAGWVTSTGTECYGCLKTSYAAMAPGYSVSVAVTFFGSYNGNCFGTPPTCEWDVGCEIYKVHVATTNTATRSIWVRNPTPPGGFTEVPAGYTHPWDWTAPEEDFHLDCGAHVAITYWTSDDGSTSAGAAGFGCSACEVAG